jgi:hypothetical protein
MNHGQLVTRLFCRPAAAKTRLPTSSLALWLECCRSTTPGHAGGDGAHPRGHGRAASGILNRMRRFRARSRVDAGAGALCSGSTSLAFRCGAPAPVHARRPARWFAYRMSTTTKRCRNFSSARRGPVARRRPDVPLPRPAGEERPLPLRALDARQVEGTARGLRSGAKRGLARVPFGSPAGPGAESCTVALDTCRSCCSSASTPAI